MLIKQICWSTAAEPVAGESQPASVSEPRGGRVHSKLDCNLPVPAIVTADPLYLRPSPPSSLYSLLYLHPSLPPFFRSSLPSIVTLTFLSLSPSLPPFPPLSSASCSHVGVCMACHQNARILQCAFVAVIDGTEQL